MDISKIEKFIPKKEQLQKWLKRDGKFDKKLKVKDRTNKAPEVEVNVNEESKFKTSARERIGKTIPNPVKSAVDTIADNLRLPAPEKVADASLYAAQKTGEFLFKEADVDKPGILGSGLTFTTKGKLAIGGLALASIPYSAFQEYENSWMGITSNGVRTITPTLQEYQDPSYLNNTNADGSLVFALNKLRNG